GVVALATLAAALLHGPALAGLGVAGAFVTPLLVASQTPNYWALYVYLAIVTAPALALARPRLWRWLAITAVILGTLWTLPGVAYPRVDELGAHLFHVVSGFLLVAALSVSGLLYGPTGEPGKPDQISSGALAAYLLAATVLVIASVHALAALTVFTIPDCGNGRYRLAHGRGIVGSTRGRLDDHPCDPALGRTGNVRSAGTRTRRDTRGHSGTFNRNRTPPGPRVCLRRAVRSVRFCRAKPYQARVDSAAMERNGGHNTDRHPYRALPAHCGIRSLDSVRRPRALACRTQWLCDRPFPDPPSPPRPCNGVSHFCHRRRRGPGAGADVRA